MDAAHCVLELGHAVRHRAGNVRVDVVVVLDGVGRAGLTFHHMGIVGADAVGAVVGALGMLNGSGEPDMGYAEPADRFEDIAVDVSEFSGTVFGDGSAGNAVVTVVGEQAGQNLVDDRFHRVMNGD